VANVVLEEFLEGEEVSFLVLSDGERVAALVRHRTTSASAMAIKVPTPEAWALTPQIHCSIRE